jgi:2-succinyl-5-enolpyruvyl-6-hydroxy-3-cyclohexene-1-carboxylate synthase
MRYGTIISQKLQDYSNQWRRRNFRILPDTKKVLFLILLETSHCLTAEHLAKMYGFEYSIASDEASLSKSLSTLYGQNDKPSLLEVLHLH